MIARDTCVTKSLQKNVCVVPGVHLQTPSLISEALLSEPFSASQATEL